MEDRVLFALQVLEILKKYSNEDNYLTQKKIVEYLEKDYHVTCERKAVGRAIKELDIIYPDLIDRRPKKPGVAITERTFSKDEVIPMMMAIYSFKGFSTKLTEQLTEKLKSDFSLKDHFPTSHTVTNSLKNEKQEVIFNFSLISEAIAKNKFISFTYINNSGRKKNWTACPHYIFVSQEEFKLIATKDKDHPFTIFNLDSMMEASILDENGYKLQDIEKYKDFDIDMFTNEHMYWFEKDAITAKIKMQTPTNKKQIVKWFGRQAKFLDDDIVEIKNDIDSLYFWLKDYSEYLEVLEPQELRDRLYNYGVMLAKKYNKQ